LKNLFLLWLIFSGTNCFGQELFPSTQPATTLPKGVLSFRFSFQNYQEPYGRAKYWTAGRLMYGVTSKLTLIGTISASNHHIQTFPGSLLYYFKYHHYRVYPAFPYLFEGFNLYAQYRILSLDGAQKHLRLSFYGEASKVFTAHDVAEPNLLGDNSGVGGGLILTRLYKRWAFSFTGGYTIPFTYKDSVVTFKSGTMRSCSFSTGYRIFPGVYSGYNDVNVNLYAEIFVKSYGAAAMTYRKVPFSNEAFLPDDQYTFKTLSAGTYAEIRPSVQFIFKSQTRIDIGSAFPIYKKSYLYYYPLLFINVQKYFYSSKGKKQKQPFRKREQATG
jgi:hypothetical protein